MTFSITAELPLGTYRGHGADGRAERLPSVARLHAALLCAAGFGPRARMDDSGEPMPEDADRVALRWLEANPPDRVSVPALQVNRLSATAYRDDGTIAPGRRGTKKLAKNAGASVAVGGTFCWTWAVEPPEEVAAALAALCPDVAHLGTSESPVLLRTSEVDVEPSHVLDPDAGLFGGAGEDVDTPLPGRLDELTAAHLATRGRAPSAARDRVRTDEDSTSPVPPRAAVASARYAPVATDVGEAPWPEVLVLPLDVHIRATAKVRWATAAHRALIRIVGEGAPPLLTGSYPPGTAKPSNRVSLQILDPGLMDGLPGRSALAVLLPRDADGADTAVVLGALRSLTSLRGPGGELATVRDHARFVSGARFWPEPEPGTVRLWRTVPAAAPDTRGDGPNWTFTHAALLSLGFVWQGSDHLPAVAGHGSARYRGIVDAVNAAGAAVVDARPMRVTTVQHYVHRTNPGAVARPYRAVLTLGALGGDRTLQAIGQSRHLGGGLLVPHDVPEGSRLADHRSDVGGEQP